MSDDKKDKKILDSDADGLFDHEEKFLGTNPNDPDTDHDGLGDNEEVNVYNTNPNNPDTDGDKVSDGEEIKMGRNPKGKGMLKDLFIPHSANNYKPHALHPKRLAFHAASAIVIKIIMVAFALSLPVQAWLSPDVLSQQATKIIELTNNVRTNLGLASLTENTLLNQSALNKAQDMLIDEYFAHVSPDNRALRHWLADMGYNYRVAGENLAIGFSSPEQVVAAWQDSPTHYSNLIDPEFTEIGVGVVSGDYNGYETTLVAQHFGEPYTSVAPEPVKPEIKEEVEKLQDYDAKVEQAVDNFEEVEEVIPVEEAEEVLAAKEEVILEQPMLINPVISSNKNLNTLTILAKGADRVTIYNNGQVLANRVLDNEQVNIAVNLSEGENDIYVSAYQGTDSLNSKHYLITVDTLAPIIDQEQTSILVNKPSDNDDIVLKATAYLSEDTDKAQVSFAGYTINLEKDYSKENVWTGHQIISNIEYKELFNPLTLATLTATDKVGNVLSQDISWQEVKPIAGSTLNKYSFLKKSNSQSVNSIFNLGNIYYKIMLAIAVLALALNVFIKIKKQHTSTIASTIGFIALIIFLTIF